MFNCVGNGSCETPRQSLVSDYNRSSSIANFANDGPLAATKESNNNKLIKDVTKQFSQNGSENSLINECLRSNTKLTNGCSKPKNGCTNGVTNGCNRTSKSFPLSVSGAEDSKLIKLQLNNATGNVNGFTNGAADICLTSDHGFTSNKNINTRKKNCVFNNIGGINDKLSSNIELKNGFVGQRKVSNDFKRLKRQSCDRDLWPPLKIVELEAQQNSERLSRTERRGSFSQLAPSSGSITISSGGGFHCAGRISKEDYTPEYVKRFEIDDARRNFIASSVKSVPVSPLTSRRRFSCTVKPTESIGHTQVFTRPPRTSVTVLTESPQFARNTESVALDRRVRGPLENNLHNLSVSTPSNSPKVLVVDNPVNLHRLSNNLNSCSSWEGSTIGGNTRSSLFPRSQHSDSAMSVTDARGAITTRDLVLVLQSIKPTVGPLPGYEMERTPRYLVGVCMDQCYPGLFIGDM